MDAGWGLAGRRGSERVPGGAGIHRRTEGTPAGAASSDPLERV